MSNDNLTKAMKIVLADTYALYLKTHNYHWNVEGERFLSLHNFFEEQYNDLATAVDEIAETILQLGQKAPGSFKAYIELTNIKDGDENASAQEMVADLAKDQGILIESLTTALEVAQEIGDEATADLAIGRIAYHRKTKWMLEASAQG
ncbi:MAG: Dps family protein [Alphaproteobacteria bacterium]